ncbi:hypothetical protein [Marichromatium gracile]|uniref:hypothetical protein n=1 Tax=Marichromatium gracile TaxID=1048 RepID=UPI001902E03C
MRPAPAVDAPSVDADSGRWARRRVWAAARGSVRAAERERDAGSARPPDSAMR